MNILSSMSYFFPKIAKHSFRWQKDIAWHRQEFQRRKKNFGEIKISCHKVEKKFDKKSRRQRKGHLCCSLTISHPKTWIRSWQAPWREGKAALENAPRPPVNAARLQWILPPLSITVNEGAKRSHSSKKQPVAGCFAMNPVREILLPSPSRKQGGQPTEILPGGEIPVKRLSQPLFKFLPWRLGK